LIYFGCEVVHFLVRFAIIDSPMLFGVAYVLSHFSLALLNIGIMFLVDQNGGFLNLIRYFFSGKPVVSEKAVAETAISLEDKDTMDSEAEVAHPHPERIYKLSSEATLKEPSTLTVSVTDSTIPSTFASSATKNNND